MLRDRFMYLLRSLAATSRVLVCAALLASPVGDAVASDSVGWRVLLEQGRALQSSGLPARSIAPLQSAYAAVNADSSATDRDRLQVELALGSGWFETGQYIQALEHLDAVAAGGEQRLAALALNQRGAIRSALNDTDGAIADFEAAANIAQSLGEHLLEAQLTTNRLRHLEDSGEDPKRIGEQALVLAGRVLDLPPGAETAQVMVSLAGVQLASAARGAPDVGVSSAVGLLNRARTMSANARLGSEISGLLGRAYELRGRLEEALRLSREAAFRANADRGFEMSWRWEWQIARLLRARGDTDAAVATYQLAINSLERVREALINGSPFTFPNRVQPLFTEFADLLLANAAAAQGADQQAQLRRVQQVIEQAKQAELQDYFQNECVLPETSVGLGDVESSAAVLYPLILDDRVEVLVTVNGTIHQFVSRIERADFEDEVQEFRELLQDPAAEDYLELAIELHQTIIAPARELLDANQIETLLVVPDGVLRTVPMAALHDGREFLVERFAVATTPGLSLTLPRPLTLQESRLFAGGVSEAIDTFTSLPAVPRELSMLRQGYDADVIQDAAFMRDEVFSRMASPDYSVIHIATHGHFDRNPQQSFLLTWDGRLTMDALEQSIGGRRYLGDPLELLVLSACETAAGDSRAALGLAGVALKSGARSALATLWQISDEATVRLIERFYAETANTGVTKAQALRAAQRALIDDVEFSHPVDWAPFLLIGNWL